MSANALSDNLTWIVLRQENTHFSAFASDCTQPGGILGISKSVNEGCMATAMNTSSDHISSMSRIFNFDNSGRERKNEMKAFFEICSSVDCLLSIDNCRSVKA